MPHTIIEIRTWSCPECGYTQDFEPTHELMDLHFNNSPTCQLVNCQENECPSCALRGARLVPMRKETDPSKKMRMTVMGEEDIELEIEERTEETYRTRRLAEVASQVESMDTDGEFPTSIARDRFKARRETDVEEKIISLKDEAASDPNRPTFRPQGYFLTTPDSISNYRTKRLADISKAITKARELEN